MAIKRLKKLNSPDRIQNLIQDNTEDVINDIINSPFLSGNALTEVELTTGQDNVINHKLGKKLTGWIITSLNASAIIYDTQADNNTPNKTLILRTSANCTVNLYVF